MHRMQSHLQVWSLSLVTHLCSEQPPSFSNDLILSRLDPPPYPHHIHASKST